MDRKALPLLRKNLKEFIKADPREITLQRVEKVPTDNGSWIEGDPEEIDPQIFRIVPMKRRLSNLEVDTQDGDIPLADFVLVGFWNADCQADDEFDLNGDKYKVVQVEPKINEDRSKADRLVVQVTMRGGKHDGDGEAA